MSGNTLRASVELDDGGVTKKLNAISEAFDRIGGRGAGASLFGNVAAGGLAAIGEAVGAGFNLISDPIGTVIGLVGDAIQAAEKEEASVALLRQSLQNNVTAWNGNMDAINAYLDAQIARGFADDDTRASLGQLVGVTHDVQKAQELNTLAQDLARAKGLDLASATDVVTKAAQGNGRALKSLGIDTAGATDAAGLLEAVQKNVAGSTDAYNQTLEGKLNIAQQQFNEAVERAGGVLMPVVADGMQFLVDDVFPVLATVWDAVTGAVGGAVSAILDVLGAFGRINKAIGDFLGSIGAIKGIGTMPSVPGLPIPKFAEPSPTTSIVGPTRTPVRIGGGSVPRTQRPQGVRVQADRQTLEMIDRGEGLFRLYRTAPAS